MNGLLHVLFERPFRLPTQGLVLRVSGVRLQAFAASPAVAGFASVAANLRSVCLFAPAVVFAQSTPVSRSSIALDYQFLTDPSTSDLAQQGRLRVVPPTPILT